MCQIISRAVPGITNANLMKATIWWPDLERNFLMNIAGKCQGSFMFSTLRRNKRIRPKTMSGRGTEIATWITELYNEL